MVKRLSFFITLFIVLLISSHSSCQWAGDSVFYEKAINNLKVFYFSTIKEKTLLYNGYDYNYFGREATGTPFFLVDTVQAGAVFYNDILYEDVPLRYDIVNDVLLVKYLKDNNTLQLLKDRVDYFSILGHQFIRLNEKDLTDQSPGFYELLHRDMKTMVLARRNKKLMLSSNAEDKSSAFVQYDQYFIYKDGKYSSANSENELVDVFKDQWREIKKFIRNGKLKFKKNEEQVIVNTAIFYNGLSR